MDKKVLPAKGKILIADPFLKDEYFIRSVVIIADHNEEGTFGFIINRSVDLTINDALENFPEFNSKVFLGGPVSRESVYYLHTYGELINGSQEIAPGIFWGGDFEDLKKRIEEGLLEPTHVRFLAGYAGWEPKQLETELKDKAWIVSEAPSDLLFNTPSKELWGTLLKRMGVDFAQMANYPIDPSLN